MTKRRANKAERVHMGRVAELGCLICRRPAECHHILHGAGMGQRAGNYEVIPLCPDHHRNGGHGVAIHAGILTWEDKYGTEADHLRRTLELVA